MSSRRWVPGICVLLLAVLALAPVLLSRGYVLVGDMTFVPRQPWRSAWLGLDGSVPRAVPADALVSLLSHVLPADVLQKVVLLGSLLLAGLGTVRLVRSLLGSTAVIAPAGAAVLYVWNPFVLERLAIGHWGLLVGYAALPWVADAAVALRRGGTRAWSLVPGLAAAAFASPTGGVAALLVALVLVVERARPRQAASVLGLGVVLNLPWLLPALLASATTTDPGGVDAFAARSDSPLGLLGSLLTFGGIWKQSIVPGERGSWFLVAIALVVSLAGGTALLVRSRRSGGVRSAEVRGADPAPCRRLLLLALVGLVLAALPTTGPGRDLVRALVEHVPGAGLLRDSQKWLLLLVLPVCVGVGLALDGGRTWLERRGALSRGLLGAVALAPVVLLPSLAWGIAGDLQPVSYPAEWAQVREVLEAQPSSDRVTAVFPWSAYRRLAFNDDRAALDPALRYFPGDVLTDDALPVGRSTVAGEDPAAARISAALDSSAPLRPVLAGAGVRYVLIERGGTDPSAVAAYTAAAGARTLHDGPGLLLLDLGSGHRARDLGTAWLVVTADLVALALLGGTAIIGAVRRIQLITDDMG
jgi:hypothetical protein